MPIKTKRKKDPFGLLAFLHWHHDWNNWHFNDQDLLKAVKQIETLGVKIVRVDILWSDVDRGYLKYDFARYEKIISLLTNHKIDILGVLQYNKEDNPPNQTDWNRPPDSFEEFAAYVGATVNFFKSKIHHWEIWNEPNLHVYWSGPKDQLRLYSRLLKLSYEQAKKADPSCFVLNGGLTEPIVDDVRNLYRQGAKAFTDILNIHTFIDPFVSDPQEKFGRIINGVRKIMTEEGDKDKKIWITEMGCPGLPPEVGEQIWFAGKGTNEMQQAEWVEKMYKLIEPHPSVEKLFWAFYRDTDNQFKDAVDYLGLVRKDFSEKPAFKKMKELIRNRF